MSEADTIRELAAKVREGLTTFSFTPPVEWYAERQAALTALERRAEQAERTLGDVRAQLADMERDFDAMEDRAEQAERERDEWRQGKARAMGKLEQAEARIESMVAEGPTQSEATALFVEEHNRVVALERAIERVLGDPGPIVMEDRKGRTTLSNYDLDWFRPTLTAALAATIPGEPRG